MSYRKAEEILPRELIEVIQQYVDGENIYIPRKLEHRKGWGERTQARQELDARNSAICREHREGASVPETFPEVLSYRKEYTADYSPVSLIKQRAAIWQPPTFDKNRRKLL